MAPQFIQGGVQGEGRGGFLAVLLGRAWLLLDSYLPCVRSATPTATPTAIMELSLPQPCCHPPWSLPPLLGPHHAPEGRCTFFLLSLCPSTDISLPVSVRHCPCWEGHGGAPGGQRASRGRPGALEGRTVRPREKVTRLGVRAGGYTSTSSPAPSPAKSRPGASWGGGLRVANSLLSPEEALSSWISGGLSCLLSTCVLCLSIISMTQIPSQGLNCSVCWETHPSSTCPFNERRLKGRSTGAWGCRGPSCCLPWAPSHLHPQVGCRDA